MPKRQLEVFWTDNALENAANIKVYLISNFSDKEVNTFYSLLNSFGEAVSLFPELYPRVGKRLKIRRAVLSKVMSVFYRIAKNKIEVLAILDNRCDLKGWLR